MSFVYTISNTKMIGTIASFSYCPQDGVVIPGIRMLECTIIMAAPPNSY